MSWLDAMSATRLCSQSDVTWEKPAPMPVRRQPDASMPEFSWRSFLRNPTAVILSAVISANVLTDAARAAFAD